MLAGQSLLAVAAGAVCLWLWRKPHPEGSAESRTSTHEPALTCICAALLVVLLTGTIRYSLTAGAVPDHDRLKAALQRRLDRSRESPQGSPVASDQSQAATVAPKTSNWFAGRQIELLLAMGLLVISAAATVHDRSELNHDSANEFAAEQPLANGARPTDQTS
jgi:hypothetical protein